MRRRSPLQLRAVREGELERAVDTSEPEFTAHIGAVVIDRARAEAEALGDLLGAQVGGDQFAR